jgi:hypothetical protein
MLEKGVITPLYSVENLLSIEKIINFSDVCFIMYLVFSVFASAMVISDDSNYSFLLSAY